jgi:hypothetical protein
MNKDKALERLTALDLKYEDIQSLIKNEMEGHFKCKGVTPWDVTYAMQQE